MTLSYIGSRTSISTMNWRNADRDTGHSRHRPAAPPTTDNHPFAPLPTMTSSALGSSSHRWDSTTSAMLSPHTMPQGRQEWTRSSSESVSGHSPVWSTDLREWQRKTVSSISMTPRRPTSTHAVWHCRPWNALPCSSWEARTRGTTIPQ